MMNYIRVISIFVNTPYIIGDNSLWNFAKKAGRMVGVPEKMRTFVKIW